VVFFCSFSMAMKLCRWETRALRCPTSYENFGADIGGNRHHVHGWGSCPVPVMLASIEVAGYVNDFFLLTQS
jgi:hypothetical protein